RLYTRADCRHGVAGSLPPRHHISGADFTCWRISSLLCNASGGGGLEGGGKQATPRLRRIPSYCSGDYGARKALISPLTMLLTFLGSDTASPTSQPGEQPYGRNLPVRPVPNERP